MEKKLLALLFVIGLVAYAIYLAIPFILACAALVGLVYLVIKLYARHTQGIAHWGAYIITPLLIVGWMYIGYLCYANFYCNTYIIGYRILDDTDYGIKPYKIVAKSDEEVIVQAWNNFVKEHKQAFSGIENSWDKPQYIIYLYNKTHDKLIPVYKYDSFIKEKKLHYNNGKFTINFYDYFSGW